MYYGVDIGRGYVKIANEKGEVIKFPSYVASGKDSIIEKGEAMGNSFINNLSVKVNGKHYFIGEKARTRGSREFSHEKAKHGNTIPLTVTAIAIQSTQDCCPYVCIGLPINVIKEQKQRFIDSLVGNYKVELPNRTINIELIKEQILVFPEAAGTFYDLLLDNYCNVKRPDLASKSVGIIDIGWSTVNFLLLDNLILNDDASGTFLDGVSSAFSSYFQRISQKKPYTMADAERKMDILADVELKEHAGKIKDQLNLYWKNTEDITIFLSGGGAKGISPYFNMEHTLLSDCQDTNARGFAKVCVKKWKR